MSQEFHDVLARLSPAQKSDQLDATVRELDALTLRLAALLNVLGDARARQELLACFNARLLTLLVDARPDVPPAVKLTPELLEWARNQFTEEELVAGIREIEATGGLELDDFIRELEQEAAPRE
jgi:hypothetical protein